MLVRFKDVLQNLCGAFRDAASLLGYTGGYRAVYPIKVNQQRGVVEQIVAGGGECVGLEAGSKPELTAVLASAPAGGVIVCNGYKDREYIRLALIGLRLGHAVYIVIEKKQRTGPRICGVSRPGYRTVARGAGASCGRGVG